MKKYLKHPILCLSVLIIGSSTGCVAIRSNKPSTQANYVANQPTQSPSTNPISPTPNQNLNYVAEVVQNVGSAVVRIDSTRTVSGSVQDPIVEHFFGEQPDQKQVQRGTGSGFIINSAGRVLTNAHVVDKADEVSVVLKDGRRFEGKVIGSDPVTDVAVVQINATGLPTVQLANSDNIVPGQWAIAIGNPLGLNNTVTQGIISATDRSSAAVGVPTERVDFIQTDAAINPGNSGGPLLDATGKVVGINTAIIQGAQGLGFAIPINTANQVAEQLIKTGHIDHPYVGIQMAELTPDLRTKINQSNFGFQVQQDHGVIIVDVQANSPAAAAGLRPGDIIQSINGTAIQHSAEVQQQVEANGLNQALRFTVSRNGQTKAVTIQPKPLPTQATTG
jgi:S1-C subfamily serine protease